MKKHLTLMLAIAALSTGAHAQVQGAKNLGAATSDAVGGAGAKAGAAKSSTRAGQYKTKPAKPMTSQQRYRMLRPKHGKAAQGDAAAAPPTTTPAN